MGGACETGTGKSGPQMQPVFNQSTDLGPFFCLKSGR